MNNLRARKSLSLLLYVLLLGVQSSWAQTPEKQLITATDLLKFTWIADAQISPDGNHIAYVRVTVNQNADRYETSLWLAESTGSLIRQITFGTRDLSPRWSPDGKAIAFLRTAEKDGKTQPQQIFWLSLAGGEPHALTNTDNGVSSFEWAPDGKAIAFIAAIQQTPKPANSERVSDVRIITRAVYRANGGGYTNPATRNHLFTVALPSTDPIAQPKQITSGSYSAGNFQWSPDGKRLYFISNRIDEPYYQAPQTELFSIAPDGTDEQKVLRFAGTISTYKLSPDGKKIAFIGAITSQPILSYQQPDLFLVDAKPDAKVQNLTAKYDFDIGGGIGGDQHAPRGNTPNGISWSPDLRSLIVNVAEHGRANLKIVEIANGTVQPLTTGNHEVIGFTNAQSVPLIAMVISDMTNIGDIFLLDQRTRSTRKVTRNNEALFGQLALSAPEEIWYSSFDGRKIQGWIQKPPNFDPTKKYPLILQIHGGPHSAYGFTFTHEFHLMAAKGYVVLYTNPRGSTSYGQDFGNIIQYNYPGDDYRDLMLGVDEILKRGYIDQNKLGVTGGSGGGVLTNWIVGKTQRFVAAVSQRSIADWAGFWYTADFWLSQPTWFRGAPWEDPKDFAARSPLTYVDKITTPMMFIEGEADLRTPPANGGEMMFRALKYRKIPTAMIRFPNETHELSRSGAPWHRVERLQHIVNWFDKFIMGKAMPMYD